MSKVIKGIRWRLTFTYLSLILLLAVIIGSILTLFLRTNYINNLKREMETNLFFLSAGIDGAEKITIKDIIDKIGTQTDHRITIIDSKGNVIAESHKDPAKMENHLERPEFQDAFKYGVGWSQRYSSSVEMEMLYLAHRVPLVEGDIGVARISVPLGKINQDIRNLQKRLGGALLISALITALVAFKLTNNITKPIENLTQIAKEIAKGNFNQKVYSIPSDEIGELSEAINQMAKDLNHMLEQIKQGRDQLETVLANIGSGVIFVNSNGLIQLANKEAKRILSLKGNIEGKPLLGIIQNYQLTRWLDESQKGVLYQKGEIEIKYPEKKTLEITVTKLPSPEKDMGLVILLYDITELRRLEKQRADFVANVSHEFKTPLTAIKGFSENIAEEELAPEIVKEFGNIIKKEAIRLDNLVNDLLTLSRMESKHIPYNFETVDISKILEIVVERYTNLAKAKGLDILYNKINCPKLLADKEKLEIAFSNIIDNAIKYSSKGLIKVSTEEIDNGVIVRISDEGIGIPGKDINRIFERFYRVDKDRSRISGGTGLGLSIVKHIVRQHEGTISVSSEINKGTVFTIFLPKKSNAKNRL